MSQSPSSSKDSAARPAEVSPMNASSLMRSVQSREHSKASAVHEPPLMEDVVFLSSQISETEVFNSITSDGMSPTSASLRDSSGGHKHASQSHAIGENATTPTSREVGLRGGSKSKFNQQPLCCKAVLWCFGYASRLSGFIPMYNLEPSEGSAVFTQDKEFTIEDFEGFNTSRPFPKSSQAKRPNQKRLPT